MVHFGLCACRANVIPLLTPFQYSSFGSSTAAAATVSVPQKKYNACYSTSQRQYYHVLLTKKTFTTLVFKLYKPMLYNLCNLLQWIQAHAIAATGTHIHSTVLPSQLTDHVVDRHTSPPIQRRHATSPISTSHST